VESDSPEKVADGGGADSMLPFWLKRGRRRNEVLLKDEAEVVSSFWLHEKEA
jgi:hypothetical protein